MNVKERLGRKNYESIHSHIRHKYKNHKPKVCQKCGLKYKRIEWANITGIYDRNINNYTAMCSPCHKRFDLGMKDGFCKRGHELKGKNVYLRPNNAQGPQCQICLRSIKIRYKLRKGLVKPTPEIFKFILY